MIVNVLTAWGEALSRVLNSSSSLPCRNVRRVFYLINSVKTTLPCLCLTGTLSYKYLVRFARALTAGLGLVLRVRWGYKPGACRRGGAEVRSDGPGERRAGQSWRRKLKCLVYWQKLGCFSSENATKLQNRQDGWMDGWSSDGAEAGVLGQRVRRVLSGGHRHGGRTDTHSQHLPL